ncbi:MAG TPA: ComF family protein [Terriglobales bacterium]|nr:ComF family protein [Terriglobales bacterium]
MGWLGQLLSLLYPPTCFGCGSDAEDGFCPACRARIAMPKSPLCSICGQPFVTPGDADHLCGDCLRHRPHFGRARACAVYDAHDEGSPLRSCLHAYKYQRRADLAAPLAGLMQRACPFDLDNYDLLIPVPLHLQRLRWRGFNQAVLLVKPLAQSRRATVDVFSLVRARPTVPQVELSEIERRHNVRHAFVVARPDQVRRRRVLLVDDVMTTGATVDECAKVLKRAGAAAVDVLVLARAVVR